MSNNEKVTEVTSGDYLKHGQNIFDQQPFTQVCSYLIDAYPQIIKDENNARIMIMKTARFIYSLISNKTPDISLYLENNIDGISEKEIIQHLKEYYSRGSRHANWGLSAKEEKDFVLGLGEVFDKKIWLYLGMLSRSYKNSGEIFSNMPYKQPTYMGWVKAYAGASFIDNDIEVGILDRLGLVSDPSVPTGKSSFAKRIVELSSTEIIRHGNIN